MVISRRSQSWMRTDRWAIEAQTGITYIAVALLVTFHKLLFQPQAFSLSLYEKFCLHSLTKFVQSWTLNSYFLLSFGLETSDRRKPAKCLSPRREGNKIIYVFVACFLVWLGRSIWENLDLDRWCRPHCVRSVLATSVKILPYRPPTRLIRANYWVKTEKSSVIPRFSLYRGSWYLGSTVFIN